MLCYVVLYKMQYLQAVISCTTLPQQARSGAIQESTGRGGGKGGSALLGARGPLDKLDPWLVLCQQGVLLLQA